MDNELEEDRNEVPPRKRLLTDPNPKQRFVTASPESTVSSDSSSDRLAKKTRDLPNLSDCHSCAVRINYTNPIERLQPLDSMWRVVLLCKKCTKRVKSSELCPYCFSVVDGDNDCFKCRVCQHSIHKDCVAKYASGLGFSVCVDCWVPDAIANSIRAAKKKSKKHKESCDPASTFPESRVSDAAKASEHALNTSVIAKSAGSSDTKVVDENDLDLIIHREVNSSPRIIPKYACLMSSFTGDNPQIACYSRRRARKKTSLINSDSLGVPLIFYSRRRSSNKACSRVREYKSFINKLSEGTDNHVSVSSSSSSGLKGSNCGSNAECQEKDGVRCCLDPHRFLIKYHRIGKCNSRLSKDSDCVNTDDMSNTNDFGSGGVSEIGQKDAYRFLLKYKRSKPPAFLVP